MGMHVGKCMCAGAGAHVQVHRFEDSIHKRFEDLVRDGFLKLKPS